MISRAIAFDAEDVAVWIGWISNGQIDEKAGDPDLAFNLVSLLMKCASYLFFEYAVVISASAFGHRQPAGAGEVEEQLEGEHAFANAGKVRIDLLVGY